MVFGLLVGDVHTQRQYAHGKHRKDEDADEHPFDDFCHP